MRKRFVGVLAVVVFAVAGVLPGAAMASPSPRAAAALAAPFVLDWTQRNASGFGDKNNAAVSALEAFGGHLYAGTTNDHGAQIWRTADGANWTRVTLPGFNNVGNGVLFDMTVFNGYLYAGVGAWPVHSFAGQIWRTANGTSWERVTGAWEANINNAGVNNFATFGGMLYATTYNPVEGIEIYRSATGASDDWARVATASFGLEAAYGISTGLAEFNNALYVAIEGYNGGAGMRVLRTSDGVNWAPANTPGFGNKDNYASGGFGVHQGYLYAGTRNNVTGGQIWRTADGGNWAQVATPGFGDPLNYKIEGFVAAHGTLFAFADNDITGAEVWSSSNGVDWEASNQPGFGSANNKAVALWSNGSGVLANQLFLGTFNQEVGGQVWSARVREIGPLTERRFLPMTFRP
jgi:hypothetical protein